MIFLFFFLIFATNTLYLLLSSPCVLYARSRNPKPRSQGGFGHLHVLSGLQNLANGRSCVNFVETAMWEVGFLEQRLKQELPTQRFQENSHKTFHLPSFEDLINKIWEFFNFSRYNH